MYKITVLCRLLTVLYCWQVHDPDGAWGTAGNHGCQRLCPHCWFSLPVPWGWLCCCSLCIYGEFRACRCSWCCRFPFPGVGVVGSVAALCVRIWWVWCLSVFIMQSFPHPLGGGVGVGSVAAVCICSEFGACRRSWCCRFPLSSPRGLGGGEGLLLLPMHLWWVWCWVSPWYNCTGCLGVKQCSDQCETIYGDAGLSVLSVFITHQVEGEGG